jgi:hypothetical protein
MPKENPSLRPLHQQERQQQQLEQRQLEQRQQLSQKNRPRQMKAQQVPLRRRLLLYPKRPFLPSRLTFLASVVVAAAAVPLCRMGEVPLHAVLKVKGELAHLPPPKKQQQQQLLLFLAPNSSNREPPPHSPSWT